MNQIKFLAITLLSMSLIALHSWTPPSYVYFIPADEGDFKLRPADLEGPLPRVLSLEEAVLLDSKKLKTPGTKTEID